jgi:hypothetical protein
MDKWGPVGLRLAQLNPPFDIGEPGVSVTQDKRLRPEQGEPEGRCCSSWHEGTVPSSTACFEVTR